jgi:membrane protein DedA with SNARE-associated domain
LFLTHLTDSITTFITSWYAMTGLVGIVLAMAVESCCIPLPSEIVMPVAGGMVYQLYHNKLASFLGLSPALPFWVSLILVALAGALGCLIGSMAAYGIGYAGGRPLMLNYGRYVLISQHDADKADAFFQRWGSATAFFSRLLPIVRTYISLPAGIARMPFARFCLYTFLGSFPWCLLLAYVGTVISENSPTLSSVFHGLDAVVIVAVVVLVALYIWRHIRNDRRARALHAAEEATLASMAQQQPFMQNGWERQPQQPQQPQQQWGQSQQWGQQPPKSPQPGQQTWGQQSQPQQQGWGQPMPPSSPQQSQQQQGWGQQVPQQPTPQHGWDQQPLQPPQQSFQQQGQGWGQQAPQQPPQQQQWGRVQSPQQQPPQQPPWPSQNGTNGWDGQRR